MAATKPCQSSRAAPAQLSRFVLLPSGEAYLRLSDCSLVHLNAAAGAFSLLHTDGTTTRGLVRCATSSTAAKVRLALHLRNSLTPAAPRIDWPLLVGAPRYFDAVGDLGPISWPRTPSLASIIHHDDGALRVLSLDRRAWLLLHPDGHTFCVCFPQSAGPVAELEPSTGAAAVDLSALMPPPPPPPLDLMRHVFCTQLHSALIDPPPAWAHPLRLAQQAAATARDDDADASAPVTSHGASALVARHGASAPVAGLVSSRTGWASVASILLGGLGDAEDAAEAEEGTTAPLPDEVATLVTAVSPDEEVERRAAASSSSGGGGGGGGGGSGGGGGGGDGGVGGGGGAYYGYVDDDVVRCPLPWALPRSAPAESEWRLRSSLSAVNALAAGPLGTELPAEGARLVLTPHALFRLSQPASHPPPAVHRHAMGHRVWAEWPLDRPGEEEQGHVAPLSMHVLADDTYAAQLHTSSYPATYSLLPPVTPPTSYFLLTCRSRVHPAGISPSARRSASGARRAVAGSSTLSAPCRPASVSTRSALTACRQHRSWS